MLLSAIDAILLFRMNNIYLNPRYFHKNISVNCCLMNEVKTVSRFKDKNGISPDQVPVELFKLS